MSWAQLLKRVFDIEHCPNCGGALKIIAAIEDPPVIDKILSHLRLRPAPRRVRRRVESIYSRQLSHCPRKPTARLALTSSERRDPAHFARLRPLRRPSRPKQHRDFHQTESD